MLEHSGALRRRLCGAWTPKLGKKILSVWAAWTAVHPACPLLIYRMCLSMYAKDRRIRELSLKRLLEFVTKSRRSNSSEPLAYQSMRLDPSWREAATVARWDGGRIDKTSTDKHTFA